MELFCTDVFYELTSVSKWSQQFCYFYIQRYLHLFISYYCFIVFWGGEMVRLLKKSGSTSSIVEHIMHYIVNNYTINIAETKNQRYKLSAPYSTPPPPHTHTSSFFFVAFLYVSHILRTALFSFFSTVYWKQKAQIHKSG